MSHVLLGWELGAGRGHIRSVLGMARLLAAAGHEVSLALQRPDLAAPSRDARFAIWQAPVTPRLLVSAARVSRRVPATMGDILARVGMEDAAIVAAMVDGWRRLFGAIRPDAVVADFAPFLLLAARGRLPAAVAGDAFLVPPADLPSFPTLIDHPPAENEAAVLAAVNDGLARNATAPLAALPALFGAGKALVKGLPELDPYAAVRRAAPLVSPVDAGFEARAAHGDEVFVYAPETVSADSPLWRGLAASGARVRVHIPSFTDRLRRRLAELGLIVEPEPVPIGVIAERSRLLVSHGPTRFISEGFFAGLPHVVFHYDLEKLLNGLAVARLGLGGHVALAALKPDRFGADLARLHADEALASRARAAADGFRARRQQSFEEAVVEAVAALT